MRLPASHRSEFKSASTTRGEGWWDGTGWLKKKRGYVRSTARELDVSYQHPTRHLSVAFRALCRRIHAFDFRVRKRVRE